MFRVYHFLVLRYGHVFEGCREKALYRFELGKDWWFEVRHYVYGLFLFKRHDEVSSAEWVRCG